MSYRLYIKIRKALSNWSWVCIGCSNEVISAKMGNSCCNSCGSDMTTKAMFDAELKSGSIRIICSTGLMRSSILMSYDDHTEPK